MVNDAKIGMRSTDGHCCSLDKFGGRLREGRCHPPWQRALADPRDWTCGFISRADVADFLIKQIDDDAFLHKTPALMS